MDVAGNNATQQIPENGTQGRAGSIGRKGIVLCFARRKGGAKDSNCCGDISSSAQTLKATKESKSRLVTQERIDGERQGSPCGPENEDQSLAVEIGNAPPDEEETPKGERVGGDNPLLP